MSNGPILASVALKLIAVRRGHKGHIPLTSNSCRLNVKLHLKTQTDKHTSVCLVVRYVRSAMLHRNLRGRGEGGKNPRLTNKYTKFGQLSIRKIVKITATRCHIVRPKNAPNSIPGVCPFVS